jgi:hypothetical protein
VYEGPAQYDPIEGGESVLAWQVRPDNWIAVADWCNGYKLASDPNQPGSQAIMLFDDPTSIAGLGWWVVKEEGGPFSAWGPSLFTKTYAPVES